MLNKTHLRPNLPSKNWSAQIAHAHQIVSGTGEGKDPVHFTDATMTQLPQERYRLQPPKAFFDPLPPLLTQAIAKVTRRAPVNRTPAIPLQILCDMRGHSQVATLRHKISRVEPLVASHRHLLSSWYLLQHHQRGISFRGSIGHKHFRVHNQSIPVFHQQVAAVAQLGLLALAFARHLGLGIGLRRMRLIRAPLPPEVYRRIARIVWGRWLLS